MAKKKTKVIVMIKVESNITPPPKEVKMEKKKISKENSRLLYLKISLMYSVSC